MSACNRTSQHVMSLHSQPSLFQVCHICSQEHIRRPHLQRSAGMARRPPGWERRRRGHPWRRRPRRRCRRLCVGRGPAHDDARRQRRRHRRRAPTAWRWRRDPPPQPPQRPPLQGDITNKSRIPAARSRTGRNFPSATSVALIPMHIDNHECM